MAKPKLMAAKKVSLVELQGWSANQWAKYSIEPKFDGLRFCRENCIWQSRGGKEYYNLSEITQTIDNIKGIDNYLVDGELVGDDWSHAMSARRFKKKRTGKLRYIVFDTVPLFETLTLSEREVKRDFLFRNMRHPQIQMVESRQVASFEEFKELLDFYLASGCDGAMLKLRTGTYQRRRSWFWLKCKPVSELDCKVMSLKPGKGKYKNTLGSIGVVIPMPQNKWSTEITHVSGMRDKWRKWVWNHKKELIGKIVEVQFRKISKKNRLIEPRLYRPRLDK